MELKLYTAGKFAQRAGITLRTIHYYDRENILKPSSYNTAGYRLYNDEDFAKLQKILTLKYLGFSLEEIRTMIKSDSLEESLETSLEIQEKMINEKINHLNLVKKAINEAQYMLDNSHNLDWNRYINIISIINTEKILLSQYKNSSNLSARINIHDTFSTNKYGWHRWLFDQIKIKPNMKILELGCGNASLWIRNIDRIPQNIDITLSDLYEGMLEDAKSNLGEYSTRFNFKLIDAQNITFEDNTFDIVIANHMLYHVPDRNLALKEIKRILKPGAFFYASTIGKSHLIELYSLLRKFNNQLHISEFNYAEAFGLETGQGQLSKYFKNITLNRYADSLLVTKTDPLIAYIKSASGNAKEELVKDKLKSFQEFLTSELTKEGKICITKDSGVFEAVK